MIKLFLLIDTAAIYTQPGNYYNPIFAFLRTWAYTSVYTKLKTVSTEHSQLYFNIWWVVFANVITAESFSCLNKFVASMTRSPNVWCIRVKTFKKGRILCPFLPPAITPPPPPNTHTHTHTEHPPHILERQIWDWQQWFQCLFFLCLFSFDLLHSTDPHIPDCAVHSLGFTVMCCWSPTFAVLCVK